MLQASGGRVYGDRGGDYFDLCIQHEGKGVELQLIRCKIQRDFPIGKKK